MQIHVGDVPLQLQLRDFGDGLRLGVLSLLLCLRGDAGAKFSLGGSQLCLGSALQIFRRANRRPGLRGLPQGRPGGYSRLGCFPRRLLRLRGSGGGQGGRTGLRLEQKRMGELNRRHIAWRHDHPHAHRGRAEQLFGKVEWQPDTAMGRRTSRQHAAMERDARPGDALHVRHEGVVIQVRVMLLDFLDDAEDPCGCLASLRAARHRRPQDPPLGVVDGDPLAAKRNDGHGRLACAARLNGLDRALALAAFGGRIVPRRDQQGQTRNDKSNDKTCGPQPLLPAHWIYATKRHPRPN